MPLTIGQVLQDRYRIDALLGQGGMGAVYCATDLRFGTRVAIKENRMASPESLKQFEREAELLHRLRHPNLPRVTDYFLLSGVEQYLVMDYVEGEDLNQVLSRQGAVTESQALNWIGQVLDAVEYMHSQHVLHRDVKPANIKITPEGKVRLVDFGLAKVAGPAQLTTVGARAVTPGFAPPEQYGMGRTDARTDIYSVGATLYALLTGKVPPDAWQLLSKQEKLVGPRQLRPDVSPATDAAVLCAMRPSPADRFQTAAQFRAALAKPKPEMVSHQGARPAWFWALVAGIGVLAVSIAIAIAALLGGGQETTPTIVAAEPSQTPGAVSGKATATRLQSTATSPPATATPSPYLYRDDFSDTHSGWDLWSGVGGSAAYVDGEYRLTELEAEHVRWGNPHPWLDFTDMTVGVDVRLVEGSADNGMGLLVRSQADDLAFYEFEISSDGYYKVSMRGPDGWTTLRDWEASPAIVQGPNATNHLEVVCAGDQFSFYVNGIHLADVTDSTYRSGSIGLSVTTMDEGAVVIAFDDLTVRALQK
jgi:hypothetical protein